MNNTVELIGHYGSDQLIACSAWTSTNRELTEDKIARIPKLIEMLAKEGHETPFEKATLHFLVNTDIATHIHLLKHRMTSMNGESARYKELKEDKYYVPDDWEDIKCSEDMYLGYWSYLVNADTGCSDIIDTPWALLLEDYTTLGNKLYHQCLGDLTPILGRKRAKESARFFKTYNSQIQADISFNWRSFVNFQRLRNSEHAQLEIRKVAQQMLDLVKNIEGNPFEHTIKSFGL